MKWYRSAEGDQRIWFDPDEIETIAESELRKAGLFPSATKPIVDIERFLEGHLRAELDQHADLDSKELGVTEFTRGHRPLIKINRDLTGSAVDEEDPLPGLRGRWRATLAHEGTHVLLHEVLFDLNERQGTLLDAEVQPGRLMRCLKREVSFVTTSKDWREVQANRGMAALLMPRTVFAEVARAEFGRVGIEPGTIVAESKQSVALVAAVASVFDVSRAATAIRLRTLGFFLEPKATPLSASERR